MPSPALAAAAGLCPSPAMCHVLTHPLHVPVPPATCAYLPGAVLSPAGTLTCRTAPLELSPHPGSRRLVARWVAASLRGTH